MNANMHLIGVLITFLILSALSFSHLFGGLLVMYEKEYGVTGITAYIIGTVLFLIAFAIIF